MRAYRINSASPYCNSPRSRGRPTLALALTFVLAFARAGNRCAFKEATCQFSRLCSLRFCRRQCHGGPLFLERLAGHCGSTSLFVNAHHSIGPRAIVLFGTFGLVASLAPLLLGGQDSLHAHLFCEIGQSRAVFTERARLLYAPQIFPLLVETLAELCTIDQTEVLLTYPTRYTEDLFFEEAAMHFEVDDAEMVGGFDRP